MQDPLQFPKLRWPLEVRMEQVEGGEVVLIRCPLGIMPTPLALIPATAPIIACFDGTNSIEQIVSKFAEYGITAEIVNQLVGMLDENLCLDTPAFKQAHTDIKNQFINAPVREAALAGLGYSDDPENLAFQLDEYLKNGKDLSYTLKGGMVGMMSPHIDYRRGGLSYGKTYASLSEESHDLYVVLGISHQFSESLFHLTNKDFATPLGVIKCDKDFMDNLGARYGGDRGFEDEFLHKQEHSIELQIPFLSRTARDFSIAPVLIGGFFGMVSSGNKPESFAEYDDFVSALTEGLQEVRSQGRNICVLAAVDMAHVGQSFGDKDHLTPERMAEVERRDQIYLDAIKEQDKDKIFSHIAEDQDARRVCGFPAMYTLVDLFDRLGVKYKAEVFDYSQAVDYQTECAVTFAGLGFYDSAVS